MAKWSSKPLIYEINTAVWLTELSKKYERPITLSDVPDETLDYIAGFNFDVVWMMGVWKRSKAARRSALNYMHEYRPVLPDLTDQDVSGSAYAIGEYVVDPSFGGREGLANLRERLKQRGIQLILDFVPNHIATDHPWVTQKPHYMVRGTQAQLELGSDLFFTTKNKKGQTLIIGHGRDPYFPGWIDTAQLNAFSLDLRQAITETLLDIASQCDGVRCDMAMLMVNSIFTNTWGSHLQETAPETEFWQDIIPAIKEARPDFKFIAEVYWDMEYVLLEQGFDFTYDKRLYDRIISGNIGGLRAHLHAALFFQKQQVRFIENHDEPRAASALGFEKGRPAATLICTLPGAVLIHDGQLIGRHVKLPVQISRQPQEPAHHALEGFYQKLLHEAINPIYHKGQWQIFEVVPPYPGNTSYGGLMVYGWKLEDEFRLIAVNLTHIWSQGIIRIQNWDGLRGSHWGLFDVLGRVSIYRNGNEIIDNGLYVELEPFQSQIFRFDRLSEDDLAQLQHLMGM